MKKHFSIVAIALMALVVTFGSCKKEPKPEPIPERTYVKTEVSALLYFTPEFTEFFDINYTVIDFQGNEINMPLTDTVSRFFETTEKNGSMKTILNIVPKTELPEINPEREYRFSFKASALIASISNFDDFFDHTFVSLINGLSGTTIIYHPGDFSEQALQGLFNIYGNASKTVTFTVTDGNKVTAE